MRKAKFFLSLLCIAACAGSMSAQTVKSQKVQDGGSGDYKAEVVADQSLPDFTIPASTVDLKAAVAAEGQAFLSSSMPTEHAPTTTNRCATSSTRSFPPSVTSQSPSVRMTRLTWTFNWGPWCSTPTNTRTKPSAAPRKQTYGGQLLEAMDWISKQYADPASEYLCMVDLSEVVAMGRELRRRTGTCRFVDPRIKTTIMLNSGMGEISMGGASKQSLESLHAPIPTSTAARPTSPYKNAVSDLFQDP